MEQEKKGLFDKDSKNYREDYVSERVVKRATKRIYEAGGCDALSDLPEYEKKDPEEMKAEVPV